MNGQGEMTWKDGRKYIGIFFNFIRGVIRITKRMVMANSIGLMVGFIKGNGKMDCNMGKEFTLIKIANKFQESGMKDKGDELSFIT